MGQNDLDRLKEIERDDVSSCRPDLNMAAWLDAWRAVPAGAVTESQILAWVEGPLRRFFPFDRFIGAYGHLSGGRICVRSSVSSGYSLQFLSSIERTFDLQLRGCIEWWVFNRKPFILDKSGVLDGAGIPNSATKRELDEIKRFQMGVVAAHGVVDALANVGTYFSFSGVPRARPKRTLAALELIAPVLHMLFLSTRQPIRSAIDLTALTARQSELVDLALEGLSDKAIASRLGISDHTVGNHFRAIYAELGISKRSQLIALLR